MEIFLARTQGFCAGVASAVDIVELALARYGAPLYVYHEIVHNTFVVNDFRKRGVVFVEDVGEVPEGERIIFSAHGIPPAVIHKARQRSLKFLDATCPLVTKVHNEAVKFSKREKEIVLIGHKGHQELTGSAGYVRPDLLHIVENEKDIDELNIDPDKEVAYLTQTTLSVDETKGLIEKLKEKFPKLEAPPRSDICYATQNRQDAVKELAKFCDLIIICGSPNSSNSNRLRETGANEGVASYIIDFADELDINLLNGKTKVGISSGASVPRCIVDELIERIQKEYPDTKVHNFENPEKNIVFKLPDVKVLA
ncbi:MAG: 4-hydroxy-3-methylbut-2-enyl diphosphate reductase [Candidatus Omnitrophota bacterium]|nr:4-hydroxy-3-methylbut-2-enyl diphosphate reductase [Candidatus Omnitrophota bacterium]MDZ4241760.1 4-hydroxy-3-methylbut-2-enyl diphosphate reductase [Candidatus Omnitrophota bacterium]